MKKLLLSFSVTLVAATSFGQWQWSVDFDSPYYLNRIVIDNVTNSNCAWQVGQPSKTVFTSSHSVPNSIVTDTLNPVPPNDTSIFYLKHARDNITMPFHVFVLHFWYQMNGDTTDFGTIEISPDTGHTWINVLTEDTSFQMDWEYPKPTLKGSTSGWQSFDLNMMTWASATNWGFPILPIYMTADTILFRFTYITDSSSVPHDGWIIDDFFLEDWAEGIEAIENNRLISISPNPTSDEIRIHRTKSSDNERVQILNYAGQILIEDLHFKEETINVGYLPNGIYLLKYSDTKNFSIQKFIIQHE